jgi:hypothetical protein
MRVRRDADAAQHGFGFRAHLAVALLFGASAAAAASASAAQEIAALFARLQTSNCEFQRNGRWYDAVRATAHLKRKLDYLSRHGSIDDAESFIRLAASHSSVSGRPYQVRCRGAAPGPSRDWFEQQLDQIRAAAD